MLPREDLVRLRHMLDMAREAMMHMQGRSRQDLDDHLGLGRMVYACLVILGEAANAVSKETQAAHPQVQWSAIIGMRHRLIHVYFEVDYDVIWQTVQDDLPVLIAQLEQLLADEGGSIPLPLP